MGTPTKRRKLNDSSRSSPAPRSLEYFFGKQKQNNPSIHSNSGEQNTESSADSSELTDEQLARKLQAEWDQEAASETAGPHATVSNLADNLTRPTVRDDKTASGQISQDINSSGRAAPDNGPRESGVKSEPRLLEAKAKNTLSLQPTGSEEDTITSSIPFDESPLTFDPSRFVSELQNHWAAEGGNASYALLTRCFVLVNSTQSRIKIVDTLVNLLRVIIEGDPSSLLPTVRMKYHIYQIHEHSAESLDCRPFFCFYSNSCIHSIPVIIPSSISVQEANGLPRCGWQPIQYLHHTYPSN